jgi:DNA-binding response OmpR family regulator
MPGYTDKAIVYHGVLNESIEFIQKPFAPGALLKKIRKILDR